MDGSEDRSGFPPATQALRWTSASLLARLTEALADERKAIATYQRVIECFGPVRPFVNIIDAERRHAAALLGLFDRYALPVPADDWASAPVDVPASLLEACRNGVVGEEQNIALYNRLLEATSEPDVHRVLQSLQAASRDRHLPAFQRCLARRSRKPGAGRGSH